jgi:hypothetical protein
MPGTEKNIAIGQYWKDKNCRIVKINGPSIYTSCWNINFVDKDGECGTDDCKIDDLVRKIDQDEAKRTALSFASGLIHKTLSLG